MSNGMAVAILDRVDAWPQVRVGDDQSPAAQNQAMSVGKGDTQGSS